ncbi:hypothetical protein ANCCAN_09087 [Ancylostoma caninum]|uniref:Uncharacterized protein n=1 Tax=Ancylostoma caninum TaxID=29170 RepID=A0A368GKI6_ANCCA|nr:hypothetical protein ANCCAN_09087 [Ancylostoma caninum]
MTTEQMIMEIEKSQAEDDDQPLLTIQRSQTETNIEEKKLADLPIVKAFNAAEKKKMSQSK